MGNLFEWLRAGAYFLRTVTQGTTLEADHDTPFY